MYVTVRRYEGVSDPSEVARIVSERWLTIIRDIPGFVAYYWADAGDGVMIFRPAFLRTPPVKRSRTGRLDTVRGRASNSLHAKRTRHHSRAGCRAYGEIVGNTHRESSRN
jgi:hypothetical protein